MRRDVNHWLLLAAAGGGFDPSKGGTLSPGEARAIAKRQRPPGATARLEPGGEPEEVQHVEYSERNYEYPEKKAAYDRYVQARQQIANLPPEPPPSQYAGRLSIDKNKNATLWLSREFTNLFQETGGSGPKTLYGQNLSKGEIDKRLQSIDRWLAPDSYASPKAQSRMKQLGNLLREAKDKAGPEGVMLATLEGAGPREWLKSRKAVREERAHGWQRALLGEDVGDADFIQNHLYAPQINSLTKSMPKGMADHLDKNYSAASSGLRVIEAGAKFLSQKPDDFGVSWNDAADWILGYLDAIVIKYGKDVINSMPATSNMSKLIKELYAGRK